MEHSENQSLGDAINAAAAQLPIIETASLRENVETAWDALFDIAKGSAAAEVKAAFEHIHSARDRVADALTELGLAQEALREYSERTGYGGGVSTASTSSNATAAHVEHATIDPGMPIAPEKSVPQPVVLSPEQQAAIAIDEDYEKVVIQKITDDGDGRYTIDYNNNSSLSYKVVDGVPPKVGEVARFYYTGNGNLRGLVVGGRTYYYRDKVTPDIEEALTKINIQEEGRLRVVKAYEALPPFMRSRVDFNAATAEPSSPSDNRSAEEIFEDEVDKAQGIVYLVKRFKTPAAIDAFLALPYEQQCERDPGIRVFNGGRDAPPEMIREFFEAAKWYLRESAKEQ